jgi:P-type Cu+ transporter
MKLHFLKDQVGKETACFHCGEKFTGTIVKFDNKDFCCDGCKLVYELLNENNLCTYYSLNNAPGISQSKEKTGKFGYLDNEEIKKSLIDFSVNGQIRITFYIPKMHCSSCIWLLENLHKLNSEIISSVVNFQQKKATITFNETLPLSSVAALLTDIGYEPHISLNDPESKKEKRKEPSAVLKIGIAGFCFGNIMMLSFPEYFSVGQFYDQKEFRVFFGYVNLLLSLPVIFFSASDFFISAWKSIKSRYLNIDAPIALAILITFTRSIYEIASGTGAGYLDSMSGIVFFMLIGRYFQNRTYKTLSFDRDFKSYFPLAVTLIKNKEEISTPVSQLKKGNRILIRNNEIIPVDAILISNYTHIDYSFVTGESVPVKKSKGDLIYAGGRQIEGSVILDVQKEVSQSYLTELWNNDENGKKYKETEQTLVANINKYFTLTLLAITVLSFIYWFASGDLNRGLNAITTILIVACPCSLLLASTFTNGNMLRIFGRNKFYLKSGLIIEQLAKADTIVFDKTGTITRGSSVKFIGAGLNDYITRMAISLASHSSHPLSRKICENYPFPDKFKVEDYKEIHGSGISGNINEMHVKLGSEKFVTGKSDSTAALSGNAFLSINDNVIGYFHIESFLREGFEKLSYELKENYLLHLLSGDNDAEKNSLSELFPAKENLHFDQKPIDKLYYIRQLQDQNKKVIMIGDGLNDAGALVQSDAGISVSDDTNTFSPSCDAILDGTSFGKLNAFLSFAKSGKKIITASFIISLLYNVVGLSFAVRGNLSPVIAAILMPISSISIVLFTTLSSSLIAKLKGL